MSHEILIKCDGLDCGREREIYSIETPDDWLEHDGFHYCPKCKPIVEDEIAKG